MTSSLGEKDSGIGHNEPGVPVRAEPSTLSRVCNEFVWEGKYDEHGRRRTPEVPALSIRAVEEWGNKGPTDGDDEAALAVPESSGHKVVRSPGLLIRGDNKLALASLLPHFRSAIDLIYIDPPYDCGLDFRVEVPVGDETAHVHAYRDVWGEGHESYAHMMAERLMLMRELLCPEGCIFVHCDWRASAIIRLLLDDIFGRACFRNEIVWRRAPNLGRQAASSQLGRVVDSIFVYSVREGTPFRGQTPMRATPVELDRSGKPRGSKWDEQAQSYFTTAPRGDYTDESIARLRTENRVWDSPSGKIYIKYFLRRGDDGRWYKDQPVDTLWDDSDVRPLRHCPKDELGIGYATQKPEGLLRRIISWACPPEGLVADFFCGSGTTGAVAQQLGRRWIMADLGRQAIHTTRKRLVGCGTNPTWRAMDLSSGQRLFALVDFAPDDRLYWYTQVFGAHPQAYRREVLRRFAGAKPKAFVDSGSLIHAWHEDIGLHVTDVDQVVDASFADAIAQAGRVAGASRVFCLAFEYAIDIRQHLDTLATDTGISVHPIVIPPEITEPNRHELPHWLELARLDTQLIVTRPTQALVRIADYQPVPAACFDPASSHRAHATHVGLDLIDAWSIQCDWKPGQPFRPTWHAQRKTRGRVLPLESDPVDLRRDSRSLLVRVIDVFGHETRTLVELPRSA